MRQGPAATGSAPNTAAATSTIVNLVGSPGLFIHGSRFDFGNQESTTVRSYTPLKVVGQGASATVTLCDWHSLLHPNATFLSNPRYGNATCIVALKRARRRGEMPLEQHADILVLRTIPPHPNIIAIYDYFCPTPSQDICLVLEAMEGNLYQLIKARRGRHFAAGLVSSLFHQIALGLYHLHSHSFFHRDILPENILVTTTGLVDYITAPNASSKERDVMATIKIADFGSARETTSEPPYTEYVSTRWYRAPEVLLLSRRYTSAVDMWALGTVMAGVLNLQTLFPGRDQIDQLSRICAVMGSPTHADEGRYYERGFPIGGGIWLSGVEMARKVGFQFPQVVPAPFFSHFQSSVNPVLVECIRQLLLWDPQKRLTSRECLNHAYFRETAALREPAPWQGPPPSR